MPVSALFADALSRHQAGQLDQAESLYRQVLAADAGHADSLHLLGVIAYQRGNHQKASDLIGKAIAINAAAASYHANLGLVLRDQGRLDDAIASQRRAILLAPAYAEAHNNLGLLLQDWEQWDEAAASYRRAIAANAALPEAHNNLANVLEEVNELDEALASCRAALALRPGYAQAHNSMGVILGRQGHIAKAAASYRAAIASAPDYADAHNNLGHVLKSQGRFDEAVASYQTALSLGGDAATAYHGLGGCKKFTAADDALIAEMTQTLQVPGLTDAKRSLLHFTLGKIFDDRRDYARAISHFDQGNALEAERRHFDRPAFAALVDRLMAVFPGHIPPSPDASDSETPILIVGLPRSGTTLVEQILASHRLVAAGGELNFWLQKLDIFRREQNFGRKEERAAIDGYLELLSGIAPQAARVTDKMPYNFLGIGLIHRLFPKAHIVHCRRDPRDTALSLYCNRFARAQEYTYRRDDIAFYIRHYRRLMAHWRDVMPAEQFLELDYETLIADQQTASRKLLGFAGLEWDPACLEFFRTERPIDTLSSWQARQPLYRSSVERWRHYEPWLGELGELN